MPDEQSATLDLLKFQLAYLSHARVRPPAEPLLNFYDVAHTALPFHWMGLFCGQCLPLLYFSFLRLCPKTAEKIIVVLFWAYFSPPELQLTIT